jgi:hypothetical protein
MGRKRNASYKRARRAKNKARIAALTAEPRDSNRPIRSFNVTFYQRRNQRIFAFQGTGHLMDVDARTGQPIGDTVDGRHV